MPRHLEILKLLPQVNKPIQTRRVASEEDRRLHWSLDKEYFDGTRSQGYGGYRQDGRWYPVAKFLTETYELTADSKILELGCAKGFLLAELSDLITGAEIWGVDISHYALKSAIPNPQIKLIEGNFSALPFKNKYFDLTICINSLHNILTINETISALQEIQRVSSNALVTVGAFATETQKQILDSWAVVATCYLSVEDWLSLFQHANYLGDYDWFQPVAE